VELGIPVDELAAAVVRYARERTASFPVRSLDEVVRQFEQADFAIRQARATPSPGRVEGIEGPGLPRGGVYAEVVAERI
jgi:hypothetical protein